jgi:imidazolonepropionase-like amidohydrolase
MYRSIVTALAGCAFLLAASPKDPYAAFPDRTFAITNVTVIDGLGSAPKADWTVTVADGKIERAGPATATVVPPGTRVIDGRGMTLIPGIVGLHEHLYYEIDERMASAPTMLFSAPKLYLAAGVTSARTTGSLETYAELNLKRRIDSGSEPGPYLDVTGPYLSGPNDPLLIQQAALSSPEDAKGTVDFWTDRGVTSFKAFLAITRAELAATITEAHARGALVAGHLCSVTMSEAADLGIDELEHGIVQSSDFVSAKVPDVCPPFRELFRSYAALQSNDPRIAALIDKLVRRHVAVTSTLAVMESGLGLAPPLKPAELALLSADARAGYVASGKEPQLPGSIARHIVALEMAFERAFVSAGGLLTEGADAGVGVVPGFADHREIELLMQAGFTPVQAIQIATSNGAKAMRTFSDTGSIEPGKRADLVLLRGNLNGDGTAIEHPVLVVKGGAAYDPAALTAATVGQVGRQ